MEDERLKNKNFMDACKRALSGIWYAIKTQTNIKIQLVIAIIVVIAAIVLKLNTTECIFLCFATMLVIITEVINTAIETVVNLCTDKYHKLAKIAKDVAAGAVLLSALNAVIVAVLIFISKI